MECTKPLLYYWFMTEQIFVSTHLTRRWWCCCQCWQAAHQDFYFHSKKIQWLPPWPCPLMTVIFFYRCQWWWCKVLPRSHCCRISVLSQNQAKNYCHAICCCNDIWLGRFSLTTNPKEKKCDVCSHVMSFWWRNLGSMFVLKSDPLVDTSSCRLMLHCLDSSSSSNAA